jgi:hypothetical protein
MPSPLRWLIDKMGDDPVKPDPDETVEAGRVALWVSEIVIAKLAEDGIRATSTAQRAHVYGGQTVRIYCAARNAAEARRVIDEVTSS